jgi:iron complex transport system ATP-binding protein
MAAASLDHVRVATPDRVILDDVSLDLRDGELTALIGPNGAGKSTLLRTLAGLQACEGVVRLGGRDIRALEPRERGRAIAYLAQGGQIHWGLSVREIVALGRTPHSGGGRLTRRDVEAAARALSDCGLSEAADRPVTQLSGGERARVLFARALAVEAPLLAVDEPVASLDPAQQIAVMKLLRGQAGAGRAVIAVLHDLGLALRYADRIVALGNGRIVADAPPREIVASGALDRLYGLRFAHGEAEGVATIAARD